MTHPRNGLDISFDGPATYRIVVKGRIDQLWFEDLGEMDIRIQDQADEPFVRLQTGQTARRNWRRLQRHGTRRDRDEIVEARPSPVFCSAYLRTYR